jgi:hypothetical protein
MTPTIPELLRGCAAALSKPVRAEEAGAFADARLSTVATINLLVAQECATGVAVRLWENAALRAVLMQAAAVYGAAFGEAAAIEDGELSLAALDEANLRLRRLLIRLHEAVEAASDEPMDRKILALYRDMAERRTLTLPAKPATRKG